jgi:hypothetical protein
MSHRIEFDLRDRIVLLSFMGIVTEASFVAGVSEAVNFFKLNGMEGAIIDYSEIEVFQVSVAFIRNYVSTREIVTPEKPRVLVAPDPAVYGLYKAFQTHAEASRVNLIPVRTMAEAYEVLKLDSPVFGSEPWRGPRATAAGTENSK